MNVVDQIVGKISEVAITKCFCHIGFLCHYDDNVQNLEAETRGLQAVLTSINNQAERDQHNAQVIKPDVIKWQKDAQEMLDEVATFLENRERSHTKCLILTCPNLKWRYRLGKESKQKTAVVISLKGRGIMFRPVLSMSYPAPPPESPLTIDEDFDSRQEIFKRILEVLKDPTIKMIGVYGAGGVGKTRMVKDVHSQVKRDGLFNDVAFAVVSRNLDKKNVQGELAAQLGLTLDDHGRAEKLLARLQKGKNLVILDDVWDPLDLKEIGIPTTTDHGNNEGGCKVLVTSRKNLFDRITPKARNEVFFVPVLENKEARILFMKTAEISVNSEEEMSSVEKAVCDECAGLPVAILAIATALKGKEGYAWQDALTQLKSCNFNQIVDIDPKLFSSLKFSYDHLEPRDARSCFLLCSLFPEDANISIEDLVRYSFAMRLLDPILSALEDVRNRVLTLVKGLKASCLLLDGEDDNTVKMHDVIRDVAISIAKDEKGYLVKHDHKKWPEGGTYEGYSAISLMSKYFREMPGELGCKELRTLVLRSNDSSLPDNFFNGMETNLEVLDLSGTAIKSLPISLSKLVKLQMLFLPSGIRNLSLLGELKSLEILRLDGIYELAPEIRQLTCLKLLDLRNVAFGERLSVIPPNVLSNLTRMEELCIPDYFAEWQDDATNEERKNASLVELNSLTCLTTLKVHIPQGKSSPNNLCFENLVRFRLSIGEHLNYFGTLDDFENEESSTSILKLSSVPLEDKFKVLLLKSEVLYLWEVTCDGGEDHLGTPKQFLQTPQPSMSRPFCNLSTLDVHNCTFKYLFNLSVVRRLEKLQVLKVEDCSNMEVIVGNDEQITFPRLKKIYLSDLPNLKSFCPSKRRNSLTGVSNSDPSQPLFCEKVVVPALEELEISMLDNISEIWDKQFKPIMKEGTGSFTQLQSMDVKVCPKLVNVVPSNMVQGLRNLKTLTISNCDSVVHEIEIEDLSAVFPQLERLSLWDLHNLRETGLNKKEDSLRGINVVYPNIKEINIVDCPNLESIFSASTLRNLAHLQELRLANSSPSDSKLKAIVETPKERDGASDEPFVFPESLFNQKVVFPCLQTLYISGVEGNVKGIWDRTPPTDSFQKLTYLYLNGCHSLLYVAPSELLGSLQNLDFLAITSCMLLEEVFKNRGSDSGEGIVSKHEPTTEQVDTNVVLPRLRSVYLFDLPRLKSFCSGSKLPSSAKRDISDCPLLETPF